MAAEGSLLRPREPSDIKGRFWQITPDLLGVLKSDGYFESANPAWEAVLGWSETEVCSMSILDLLHPDDRERSQTGFEQLKQGNLISRFENRYRRKDGGYNWFAWAAASLGEAYYCSGRDITLEKARVAELEARTLELDRAWQNSRDLLAVGNSDGIFRAANPAWMQVLGYEPEEVVGKSLSDFKCRDGAEPTSDSDDTVVLNSEMTVVENRCRHKDGTFRWISWLTVTEGDLVHAYGRDISIRKSQAAALEQAAESLRQSQKMEAIGQLTGGIAHDFNNILTGIIGSLDIVRRRVSSNRLDDVPRFLDAALRSAGRAAALTHRLLAFARSQSLDTKPSDVNRLIGGMEDLLHRTLGERVELQTILGKGLWQALADANQFENAILNLAINARDAMPNGGRLTIRTDNSHLDADYARSNDDVEAGEYVMISVSDSGTGMSPETLARAFDPFFTTKPVGLGTGLGLSMIYGFAKQSGGHLRIDSEMGIGTTVQLFLARATTELLIQHVEEIETPRGQGETVLVVEDEATVRLLIASVLEELGYQHLEAPDVTAAMAILRSSRRIDLLLTDVGLPILNGRQLAEFARALRPALKVLLVTGYAEHAAVRAGVLGANMDVLTKPFALDVLGGKIREMIER